MTRSTYDVRTVISSKHIDLSKKYSQCANFCQAYTVHVDDIGHSIFGFPVVVFLLRYTGLAKKVSLLIVSLYTTVYLNNLQLGDI